MARTSTLIMSGFFAAEAQIAFDYLKDIEPRKGMRKYLCSNGKFECRKPVKFLNTEASYPVDLLRLHNTALAVRDDTISQAYIRDGYAVYCLHKFASEQDYGDVYYLHAVGPGDDVRRALAYEWQGRPVELVQSNYGGYAIRLNTSDPSGLEAIETARELYLCGAAHAFEAPALMQCLMLERGDIAFIT